MISLAPYQIRATWQWCIDNNYKPYIFVNTKLSSQCQIPSEHIEEDGTVIFEISKSAAIDLNIGNYDVSFKASFKGVYEHIYFPIYCVTRICSKENGLGIELKLNPSDFIKKDYLSEDGKVIDIMLFKSKHK